MKASSSGNPSNTLFSRATPAVDTSQYSVYAYVPNPKFDPKDYIVAEANERDIIIYKEIFDYLDSNNNGAIQPVDLRKAFREVAQYHPKRQHVYQIMADFDTDESGIIEFREFVKMMTIKPCEEDSADDIEKVFNHIDQDGKGYISLEDLQEMRSEYKEDKLTDDDLRRMIELCDPTGQGKLTWKAFLQFNKKNKF